MNRKRFSNVEVSSNQRSLQQIRSLQHIQPQSIHRACFSDSSPAMFPLIWSVTRSHFEETTLGSHLQNSFCMFITLLDFHEFSPLCVFGTLGESVTLAKWFMHVCHSTGSRVYAHCCVMLMASLTYGKHDIIFAFCSLTRRSPQI